MKRHLKNEKGLSLVELLAVIVIMAIIAAIAIPAIGNIVNNSRDKAILTESLNILAGAKIAYMEGECTAAGLCEQSVLESYVDGVTKTADGTAATYSATFADGEWTVDFNKFDDIKGDKYKLTDKSEEEIKTKLDGEAPAAGGGGGDGK
ncbi:hypothetical protein CBM15_08390 [Solibacillus kalamii]|uniref:Prepilin-type N-terminal cleavage/methylation domain-containing protein n=1 Tax=Solibacillus kalamii TaxID=1748298 RepID=A0ABX3ZI84_9BACL|nr:hypothetical protein CBM15_08390 [Solibacillus kalamii]